MEFHQRLAELRRQRGLTQEELADRLYVSRAAVSKWESGRGLPSIDSLQAIARFFGLSLDELLSTGEALTIAKEDNQKSRVRTRRLVFGLLDLGALLILLLPLFAVRTDGNVQVITLIAPNGIAPHLLIAYYTLSLSLSALGILSLALQTFDLPAWRRLDQILSLALGAAVLLLFTVSHQPYAAIFAFLLLAVKAILLIKQR